MAKEETGCNALRTFPCMGQQAGVVLGSILLQNAHRKPPSPKKKKKKKKKTLR
eukprot:NODE_834_length_588_cov_566.748373_g824_i0.p4 GENE.NODE_834_length_588_cov_566.748373_g824_i0~~NODE_834_length_588_cov_566.748373_g824_i0.p4  ORF type:complete len:53 (+),score=26.82 NODE_834_length_588_cov_566.748373_g824_i0:426-584(+)